MITIKILGLEQFIVGRVSDELSKDLAEEYETSEDNISFIAPSDMIFHKGIDQTSWNSIVTVKAPESFKDKEKEISEIIIAGLRDYTINVRIFFKYYDEDDVYEFINEEYPRFITSSNSVNVESSDDIEDSEDDAEDDGSLPSEDDLFTGDAFAGFKFPDDK